MKWHLRIKRQMSRALTVSRHDSTAPSVPKFARKIPWLRDQFKFWGKHLNFYRLHMLFFFFVPLIASGIMYGSNGENHISYPDCLFMVTSAMACCGLASVPLGRLTRWQQVLLYLLMNIGSTISVSIITIVVRRHFFKKKFMHMIRSDPEARRRANEIEAQEAREERRQPRFLPTFETFRSVVTEDRRHEEKKKKKSKLGKLRPDMIRRVDEPLAVHLTKPPSHDGVVSNGGAASDPILPAAANGSAKSRPLRLGSEDRPFTDEPLAMSPIDDPPLSPTIAVGRSSHDDPARMIQISEPAGHRHHRGRSVSSDPNSSTSRQGVFASVGQGGGGPQFDSLSRSRTRDTTRGAIPGRQRVLSATSGDLLSANGDGGGAARFPRTRTIEFRDEPPYDLTLRRQRTTLVPPALDIAPTGRFTTSSNVTGGGATTSATNIGQHSYSAMHSGFGGFPNPVSRAAQLLRHRLPTLERRLTMQRTTTLSSALHPEQAGRSRTVNYISFDAVVGRNSKFKGLTTAQQEELGGVEYRALTLLLKIVCAYWLLIQLVAVTIIAPWIYHTPTYREVVQDPEWAIEPIWFTFFQMWSAFSNLGMSLVDESMVPFQQAYVLILVMCVLILAGNTAYPIFLRLAIWLMSKVVPRQSRTRETLQFLLDHPRRCFIYLFPSTQTWFLAFVLLVLNSIDWVCFLVLDTGNPVLDAIPTGPRVLDGLFQSFAVRAAGFNIVPLSDLAPAVQVLYALMMYIAIYPIAMSIRSTNVYEERSLGVYEDESDDGSEREVEAGRSPGTYIAYHARKQLAFDMWWLVLALWLVCVVERGNIDNPRSPWISIFSILFETSSAYGVVGLSLGSGVQNTSLVGDLRSLSKLILALVIFRGRHRGLPIAIDRAVLLPSDMAQHGDDAMSFVEPAASNASVMTPNTLRPNDSRIDDYGLDEIPALTDEERLQRSMSREEEGEADATASAPAVQQRTRRVSIAGAAFGNAGGGGGGVDVSSSTSGLSTVSSSAASTSSSSGEIAKRPFVVAENGGGIPLERFPRYDGGGDGPSSEESTATSSGRTAASTSVSASAAAARRRNSSPPRAASGGAMWGEREPGAPAPAAMERARSSSGGTTATTTTSDEDDDDDASGRHLTAGQQSAGPTGGDPRDVRGWR